MDSEYALLISNIQVHTGTRPINTPYKGPAGCTATNQATNYNRSAVKVDASSESRDSPTQVGDRT